MLIKIPKSNNQKTRVTAADLGVSVADNVADSEHETML